VIGIMPTFLDCYNVAPKMEKVYDMGVKIMEKVYNIRTEIIEKVFFVP